MKNMKKTNQMATIGQFNPLTGNMCHIERRVYENENGIRFVKINRDFTSIAWLLSHGREVHIW